MTQTTYFHDRQLAERFGVRRATIWRWVREGHFPPPVKLGPATTRWSSADLDKWEAARGKVTA